VSNGHEKRAALNRGRRQPFFEKKRPGGWEAAGSSKEKRTLPETPPQEVRCRKQICASPFARQNLSQHTNGRFEGHFD